MVFKTLCVLVLWTKMALALEGLNVDYTLKILPEKLSRHHRVATGIYGLDINRMC